MDVKMSPDRSEKKIRRKARSKRTEGTGIVPKLPLWKCLLFSAVTVVAFFALVEIVLAILGVRPILYNKDPYVGFSSTIPLFVEQQGPDGQSIMVTAGNKLGLFNVQQFPASKSSDTYRIFCMGGSTTFGRPYDDTTSFCGWLRAMLRKADPSRSWEVINAGGVSYASYRVTALMEELIRYKPDLFIIYSGHNEFLERRTYSRIIEMPKVVRGLGGIASRTRIYTVMERAVDKLRKHSADSNGQRADLPAEVQTVLADSVGPEDYYRDDELHQRVLDHYRYNLLRAVDIARSVGAGVMLVTPASNIRDCSPFKSEHRERLSDTDHYRWQTLYDRADEAFSSGQWNQALSVLDEAITIDNRYAQAHYLRGRILWKLERYDEAKTAFMRAIDEDICPLRATKGMIEIVREVGRQKNVPVVDFVNLTERLSEHAIPGETLFLDHVHPTIETNRRLALLLLETMHGRKIAHFSSGWDEIQIRQITKEIEDRLDEKAHGDALRNLARVFRWAGKFEEGYKLAHRAVRMIPNDAEVHALIGATALELGHVDEAISSFHQALQIKPDYAKARSSLADILAGQGRIDEAIDHYRRAIRDKPNHADTYSNLGVAMSAKGDINEATACLKRALEIKPEFAEAHNSLGGILIAQGKLDGAIDHYKAALRIKPHYFPARYNLASAFRWQGKFNEAIRQFEQVLRTQPDYVEAHCGLGLTHLSQGQLDEALRCFHRALEIKPDCIEAHSSLGDILSDQRQLDEAINHYRQALSADPDNAHVHCNLGVAMVRKGNLDEAVNYFHKALQIKPDHMEAYNNLGSILAATGRLDEAIHYLRQALKTKSGVVPSLRTESGRTINRYSQAFQSQSDYARVHYNLGGMLVTAGAPKEALENFRDALRLKPNWPEPFNEAAKILALQPDSKVKDVDQAIRFAERAVQLTRHQDISFLETLAMCYATAGRFDRAVRTIESAIALASVKPDENQTAALRKVLEHYKQGKR